MGIVALHKLTSAAKADFVLGVYCRAEALRRPKAKSRSLHCADAPRSEASTPVGMTSNFVRQGVADRRARNA